MLYHIFRNFTYSYLYLEGLSMNGYSDAIASGFTSTREYIEGMIGDVVSAISEGKLYTRLCNVTKASFLHFKVLITCFTMSNF